MTNTPVSVRNYFKLDFLLARSHVILRQVFKNRYQLFMNGQLWNDSLKCGKKYLANVIGKSKKFNLTTVQKTLVRNGDSNEWDLTTLTSLLLNTDRPKTLKIVQIQQLDNEDKMLIELRDIRNTLAHHASKTIDNNEFHQLWSKLVAILVVFGGSYEELNELKNDSMFEPSKQPINESNVSEVLRLNSLGSQAHKEQKFSDAITLFTKAVNITDVSNHQRAIVYSNMSASRLALHEKQVSASNMLADDDPTDQRYRALHDAKQARMLSSTSWQGHFRVGKAYAALNDHEKAINSFERALALDPNSIKIQEALNDSQQVLCRQSRHEHLDPRGQPVTMQEHLNEMQQKYGIDPEQIRMGHESLVKIDPSAADVIMGHKYEHGDIDIKQNYEQAARYFAKAANQGNAEGMYNLARLTDRGLGVNKDSKFATTLLEQAAAQSAEHPKFKGLTNVGVAESEHSLGLRYAEGVSVHKNLSTAAQWYQRAVDHGSAEASNNLAILYQNGTGVEKNLKKAKQLFELSARRGDPKAMLSLAWTLLEINDLEMAKIWFDRACEAGNLYAQAKRNDFESALRQKQQIIENRPSNTLQATEEATAFSDLITAIRLENSLSNDSSVYDLNVLNEHAKRGSQTAEKMYNALRHFHNALHLITKSESLTIQQENIFIHEYAQCCRIEHTVAEIPNKNIERKIERIIDRVFQRCCNDSNLINSQLDEDVRICYVVLHVDSPKINLRFLNSCKQKYPKVVFFLEFSAAMNLMLGQFEAAVSDANAGLKIDPNYYELLFMKATVFVVLEKELDEIINAYQTFLAHAPRDHCKVPESYYSMACRYVECSDDDDLIEETYNQGEEAEKIQLPCFLPYKSDNKMALKAAFKDECSPDVIPVLVPDRRSRLTDLHRIDIFKRHRQWSASMSSHKDRLVGMTQKPRVKQPTSKSLIGLKSISLREINPTKDHVYNGYVLSVTIIDEALSWRPSIHLVIEDENYDCDHMVVYDFQDTQGKHLINEVFTIGTKMSIINPYLRIGANDGKPFIRVDDFSSIIFQHESERVVNMCRCCGQSNASHVCSRCKRARYCTKECQIMDWKLYEHKLLCIDRSYREKSLTLDGSVTQKFDGQQESTSEASQLCLPLIPIDAAQNDIRVQTSSLFPLAPAYQEKNVPLGSSVWMASNSVHLLMKRDNHLCLLDQNLNVVKKTPWASDEHVIDICWCDTLDQFFVLGDEDSFVSLHRSTMARKTVPVDPNIKLLCCTCSNSKLYVSNRKGGSNIFIYSLLPNIVLVKQWDSPATCTIEERIEYMRYSNEKLALIINNISDNMRLELRSESTMETLWSLNLGNYMSPFYGYHICPLPADEWLVIAQTNSRLLHIAPGGTIKASIVYEPRCCSAALFGPDVLAISTDYRLFLHKL
ncbi:unnamed protein product [Adineta steineri]|uniref:MYND-type domain-containing protein n=1 Tax=Adineta steineri TaxID=433720 RepID=A0A819FSD1_9BILA|nr:unnamed protein product [Adineta steineri]